MRSPAYKRRARQHRRSPTVEAAFQRYADRDAHKCAHPGGVLRAHIQEPRYELAWWGWPAMVAERDRVWEAEVGFDATLPEGPIGGRCRGLASALIVVLPRVVGFGRHRRYVAEVTHDSIDESPYLAALRRGAPVGRLDLDGYAAWCWNWRGYEAALKRRRDEGAAALAAITSVVGGYGF